MPDILARLAPVLGAEVILEPTNGFVGLIRFPNGRKSFFWDNKFNLNPISSVKICRDKAYTTYFLRRFGYRTPQERVFARESFREHLQESEGIAEALDFASRLGWPVFLKPLRFSQGELIFKAYDKVEFYQSAERIFERSRTMLVQNACVGNDYRIVVLDGEVISAYRRTPLEVVGDGRSSVEELLEKKQIEFRRIGRDTVIPVDDPRIASRLNRMGLSKASIPQPGERARIFDLANLSLGGETEEITDRLHPTLAALAGRIADDLDLRLCGIDLLCEDATAPVTDYVILEVNSAPGLDNYAFLGSRQVDYVDSLYLRVLRAIASGPRLR